MRDSDAKFILASASPRRVELLGQMGLKFSVIPAHVDEEYADGETPAEHVTRLSEKKSAEVARANPNAWVLAADTVVVLDGNILGKPDDKEDARRMLNTLSARTHEVYTGYCLMNNCADKRVTDFVVSRVKIKALSAAEVEFYLNTDEPYDKAGSYAVQGIGAFMVESIDGSYTNVVGLPLCQVVDLLDSLGVIILTT